VNESAKILGLEQLLDRRPKDMSGGQRQRVALGRAIVREPSVFLFDEPLSNLDAKLRVQMRAEIQEAAAPPQVTTIYVTHDQVEAMTMGHRIALLDKGKLQQVGTPLDVYEKPQNVFVANFIGTPPMNFIRATVADGAPRSRPTASSCPPRDRSRRARFPRGQGGDGRLRPENVLEASRPTRGATAKLEADRRPG